MLEGAKALIGKHDFASFAMADCKKYGTVRDLFRLSIERQGDSIIFELEANAFLRRMVRTVVGTLVEVGEGRIKPDQIEKILLAADRTVAGKVAPPQGLCLLSVGY